MIQEIQVGKNNAILDSAKLYSGAENPDDDDKLIRKALGLPLKKSLVYYSDTRDISSTVGVKTYQIVEMYDISEKWYTLELIIEDDSKIRIHSGYFAEMQKPSFVADMSAQDE